MERAKLKSVSIVFLIQEFVRKSLDARVLFDSEEELYLYLYMVMQIVVLRNIEDRIKCIQGYKNFIRFRRLLSISQNDIRQVEKVREIEEISFVLMAKYRIVLHERSKVATQVVFEKYVSSCDNLKDYLLDILK